MQPYAYSVRRPEEIEADFAIHLLGMLVGAIGAAALLGLTAASTDLTTFSSVLAYTMALIAMLGFSAAYNLPRTAERRDLLEERVHLRIALIAVLDAP